MNNKLILTSLLAMAVVSPAVGVSFTGTMETNKTYENAATKTNMGVDTGTVTAEAYYTIYPGYYLPANSYTPAVCPAGSYCEGLEQTTKSTTANGLTSCQSTNTYTQSDQGADAVYDCYASCPAPTNADHLASNGSFSGKLYYGDLKNCTPSACAAGYTMLDINASTTFLNNSSERYIYVDSTTGVTSTAAFSNKYGGSYDSSEAVMDAIGFISGDTWAVDFDGGLLYGGSKKVDSSAAGPVSAVEAMSASTNGQCYCWLTGYKPSGSANRRVVRSLAVPGPAMDGGSGLCPEVCARLLATNVSGMTDKQVAAKTVLLERATNDQKCIEAPYTITYSCGTGTGNPGTQNVEYNTNYTSRPGFSCGKTGYTFNNWGVSAPGSGAATVAAGTTLPYAYTSDKTYTANWNVNHYNIVYNANVTGATGTTAPNTNVAYDANQTLTANGFTSNNGFKQKFLGWARSASATTKEFDNEATVSNLSELDGATVNLYAVWGPCRTCQVDSTKMDCELSAPLGVCTYTTSCKPGYGGTIINQGQYNATGCVGNTISIGFANGGHGSAPAQTTCTYGETFTLPAALTATGYTFNKWSVNGKTFIAGANITCNYDNLGVYDNISQVGGNAVTITGTWTTNTINIVWTRIESASVQTADNNAMTNFDSTNNTAKSQVSYNGSIFTPKSVMEVTGQKFVGWKFVK